MPRSEPQSADRLRPSASVTESRLVLGLILVTLLLTSLPYLLGYFITPPGTVFIGTAYNIDDYCNYLSWLRQTMDGHFFFHNLFTTDPQQGREFSVFFWLLGQMARLAHLSPQAALQVARVGGGAVLLGLISRLYRFCLPDDPRARLTAFGFACLGSGFGWVTWPVWHDKNLPGSPVDAWQPEAYTFLSLYTSALMTVSTCFIVGALYALLLGRRRAGGAIRSLRACAGLFWAICTPTTCCTSPPPGACTCSSGPPSSAGAASPPPGVVPCSPSP